MKIKKLEIKGLHGNEEPLILEFNDDLNILSGRNGAGKTTILKLMWYLISGNFDKAIAEIKFDSVKLETDIYSLLIDIDFNNSKSPFKCDLKLKAHNVLKNFETDENLSRLIQTKKMSDINWFLTQYIESSFFMPTFRMIEGGFTTEKYDIKHDLIKEFYLDINKDNNYSDTEFALKKLSSNLTKQKHKFFTTISAKDIDTFLVKKYAEIMKRVNTLQNESINLFS
ncbi:AAA family ATPase, partial [Acinetobacter baumannii]|uniref:AAA family ATPase n=1 Tax=Acinetobacter baumannii TaxID=470 RepID=UPI0022230605